MQLDDNDIWSALKVWATSDDKILSILSTDIIDRRLFKVEIHEESIQQEQLETLREKLSTQFGISYNDTQYLLSVDTIRKDMYDVNDDHISILYKDGTIKDIAEASEILNVSLLSKKIVKYYLCYQRF